MENRKKLINNTEQFDAMRVKLSNWVFHIAAIIEKRILLCLEYLLSCTIIRHRYKCYTIIVGGINCLLNKKQAQPDPPLG